MLFLVILGPGIITAMADNDAPGITTYSLAGTQFGNKLLWSLLPTMVILIVMQEIAIRTGVVTRKALSDLIRENYGVKVTFFLMVAVLIADLGTTCAEFAGLAAATEIFGVSRYLAVPVGGFLVWWLVVKNAYRRVEKVLLVGCGFYVCYIISGVLAKPDWSVVMRATFRPTFEPSVAFVAMLIGIVGTTVAPWQQFYMQSTVVDKGLTARDYRYSRLDMILGYVFTMVVAFFIVAACAKELYPHAQIETAADAALALKPLAGQYASALFAFGLFVSALMAAAILPLSTAFVVCEGMGWEHGLDRSFHEAPEFYGLYTGIIVLGAGLVLIPGAPLIGIMFWSQVICGFILPPIFVLELLIVNRRDLMGKWVNKRWYNALAWTFTGLMSLLNLALVFLMIAGKAS
jgi:NRAMP (natural resistance-associated macrophage protein)-like metal ion transporter